MDISKKTRLVFSVRTIDQKETEYKDIGDSELDLQINELSINENKSNCYAITFTNMGAGTWKGVILTEVVAKQNNPRFFMPGYMYGRNTGEMPCTGRKHWPRIREGAAQLPHSEYFMTRSDRLAMPISMIYDEGHIYGISARPFYENGDKYAGFTCRMNKHLPSEKSNNSGLEDCETGYAACGYTIGYENAPWLFIQSATVLERKSLDENNVLTLASGESFSVEIEVFDFEADSMSAVYDVWEKVYFNCHVSPRKIDMDERKAIKLISDALHDASYIPEDKMYTGFVHDRRVGHEYDPKTGYEYNKIYSLTWTDGLTAAVPVLMAGLELGEESKVNQAEECINYMLDNCMNEASGLPYEALDCGVWSNHGWWYDGMHTPGHTGYMCGQALFYILKAYEVKSRYKNIKENKWIEWVSKVIDKINIAMNSDYEYPFAFSEKTGAGLEYNSFGSCWCLAATAYYAYLTGDRQYVDSMILSEKHYYDAYLAQIECYGGPLDTDKAIDDEGILAYIRAVRYLYEITKDKELLAHMREAIGYECSFKLCYNTPVKVPPLSEIGWSSCGGSITSVANPHIHPMSSTIIEEMMYYYKHTGDEYVKCRIEDTIGWGLQTFNTYDGEYGYGKIGWMSERFCFCEGLMTEKYDDNRPASTWFALMAWAAGSVLEGFLYNKDELGI